VAAPTFGIDLAAIATEFNGLDLTDLSSAVTLWIGRAAARASQELRRVGYEADTIAADSDDDLYQLCADYITHKVCARVARSMSLQDTGMAQYHRIAASRIADTIFVAPEAMTDKHDSEEQLGTFSGPSAPEPRARSPHRGWSRNDQF
jgi:hypothetical protein